MIQFLAQLEQGLQVVDKAAAASDRWLFLAAIVTMMISFGISVRYLVRARDKENESHQRWMETVYTENVKLTAQVLVALQDTNEMLQRIDKHLVLLDK